MYWIPKDVLDTDPIKLCLNDVNKSFVGSLCLLIFVNQLSCDPQETKQSFRVLNVTVGGQVCCQRLVCAVDGTFGHPHNQTKILCFQDLLMLWVTV